MASLNNTLEYILEMAEKPEAFCKECEIKYNSKIQKIAKEIAGSKEKTIVIEIIITIISIIETTITTTEEE
jgi:uncharacterized membrane protein